MVGEHTNPACRQVTIKRDDNGATVSLRLGNYTSETGIAAVLLPALLPGMTVFVDYDTSVTSGCGTTYNYIRKHLIELDSKESNVIVSRLKLKSK